MKDRILVLGKGFIGNRLAKELGASVFEGRIENFHEAERKIKGYSPQIIINAIGYIGRNVDDCELDKDKALMANSFVPVILGEVALRNNIRLIHISTGCFFHYDYKKDKPIDDEENPDFFELFYSRSKIYSEQALRPLSAGSGFPWMTARIIRISWIN
jgi:dTDP-4-dehydrorhamnose reductase